MLLIAGIMAINFKLNGQAASLDVPPDTPLLYALRNDLQLNGSKFGCGLGQCGACSVLVNGESIRSCITPVISVEGSEVTTLEGLGSRENPHPLQQAFIDEQAMQCGYCSSGIIISAAALLSKNADPADNEIRQALDGHICRCGTNARILRAVKRAARRLRGETP